MKRTCTQFGGGYSIVGEPLTVEKEYAAVWKRARLDTDELARLCSQGWAVKRLQDHFGFSRSAIKLKLKRIREGSKSG